ncbi:MAG TPA: ABC transporter permease [Alphaproteobacteria bacterium]|nr:ABC transporter permease [Alphaproteobacteria bacterium]
MDMFTIDLGHILAAPSSLHWLGCDELGRDVFLRAVGGLQVSLTVAFVVTLVTGLVGIGMGLAAGWCGERVRMAFNALADVVQSFPGLLLALALAALLGPGLSNVLLALCLLGWVGFYRLTVAEVRRVQALPFVDAARLGGVDVARILLRHILPVIAAPLLVEALVVAAGSMVAEAGLSYLGLGIAPPAPSLGGMLREGARYILVAPHLVIVPAVVLICLAVGLNVAGEGLRKRRTSGR